MNSKLLKGILMGLGLYVGISIVLSLVGVFSFALRMAVIVVVSVAFLQYYNRRR